MTLDVAALRADTPGLAAGGVHLAAAGAALQPRPVLEAVRRHLDLEGRLGGYAAHEAERRALDAVYDHVARLIGARPREIAILENATAAWMQAFYALPLARGARILTGRAEYAANYVAFLQRAKRDDLEIVVIPDDADGAIDVAALEAAIDARAGLIALTWMPTNGGLVNPAAAVGAVARRHGTPYLLDACQAAGQTPIDVAALGCDFLTATARKFLRGPRGVGFLYVRETWLDGPEGGLEPAMIDHFAAPWTSRDAYGLRPDARRFETWENAYALRAGLGAAADYALGLGVAAIEARARGLAEALRARIDALPGGRVHDLGRERSAIVSFSVEGLEPRAAVAALRAEEIFIGASDPASTRLDAEARGLPTLLRAAPHCYCTEEDLDRLADALGRLAAGRAPR